MILRLYKGYPVYLEKPCYQTFLTFTPWAAVHAQPFFPRKRRSRAQKTVKGFN
jgi:hypothetical protein